tara:strand:+ start:1205 stop:1864 length:660 start_codon:yes stop_codon:yes gene_type:complete
MCFVTPYIRHFVLENTEVVSPALTPELRLRLATANTPLMTMPFDSLHANTYGDPFWAFAWSGGQAVARYLLDRGDEVAGKRVFDLACGSGIIGLAAAMQGATEVVANDIDPFCALACELNGNLNDVFMGFDLQNRVGEPLEQTDVVVAGDICYEEPLASLVLKWLKDLAREGKRVFVGDPGRASFDRTGLELLASYTVSHTNEWDDEDVRRAKVFRVLP